MTLRLEPLFLAARSARGTQDVPTEGLEERLTAYVEAALAARPAQRDQLAAFVRYVAGHAHACDVPPTAHAADFFLAFGCVTGIAALTEEFHQTYAPVVARVLARRGATADLGAEAAQVLFERLLVAPPGEQAKLSLYNGLGPLKSWVSTNAATTLAMMHRSRQRRREAPEADDSGEVARLVDPELAYLKGRYKQEVEQAIIQALAALDDRQRTLLRLSAGERMSIDQLGTIYHVNRSTVARWLAEARATLLKSARAELRSTLRLSTTECDSLFALVRSQLDLSIIRHLG